MKLLKYLTGLFFLFLHFVAGAQDKSLLWKVTGNGLTKPSYLFGTIHLVCKTDYVWTPTMASSFDKAEKICLEMDLDDMNVMMAATSGLIDKTGKKLSSYFTKEQYALVRMYAKDSLGIDMSLIEMMKPVALQTLMATRSSTCEDAVSYEDNLMKGAQKADKEVLGLESPEDQLKALESIPLDSVLKGVMETVEHKGVTDTKEYDQLIAAYKKQDIAALYKMIMETGEFGNATNVLVDDRNKKWIGVMKGMMAQNTVFFAVGAGHLWGQNGVISLLKKQGYKVEAMQ